MRVDVFARCPDSDSHDNVVSVQLAVRHLAEFDHTRIGLAVGPPQRLLERGATAIVYGSDLMEFTDPPLTTIRQDVVAMGEAAVRALLEEIEGSTTRRGEHLFRPELVVRSSTGPVPTTPPRDADLRERRLPGVPPRAGLVSWHTPWGPIADARSSP